MDFVISMIDHSNHVPDGPNALSLRRRFRAFRQFWRSLQIARSVTHHKEHKEREKPAVDESFDAMDDIAAMNVRF